MCIVQPLLATAGVAILKSMDIHVQDCDNCWNPYWEDELVDGLCSKCQTDKEYAGNPNWAGDD